MNSSLRGHLLIALPKLKDSNFFKSVVLIVEHGPDGAMGLVLNRPSDNTVAESLKGHFEYPETDEVVFTGGPVEPAALFMIHDSQELDPTENPVIPGLFMGSSAEVFEDVVQARMEGIDSIRFRIYSGCAGWGPNQLEGELERGDWLTLAASAEFVFSGNPYAVWDHAFERCQTAHRLPNFNCDHPEWN